MQAEVRKGHGPAAHFCGLLFYSDGKQTVDERRFHPVMLYIANYQLDHLRSREATGLAAHLGQRPVSTLEPDQVRCALA